MALTPWNATVQNDIGNLVPSPVVTVRKSSDDSLATIYDIDGNALTNPFTGSSVGIVTGKQVTNIILNCCVPRRECN